MTNLTNAATDLAKDFKDLSGEPSFDRFDARLKLREQENADLLQEKHAEDYRNLEATRAVFDFATTSKEWMGFVLDGKGGAEVFTYEMLGQLASAQIPKNDLRALRDWLINQELD